MTKLEVISELGQTIVQLDVLRARYDRGTPERLELDDRRDDLDAQQRKLVRQAINENTQRYQELTADFSSINQALKQTIDDVNRFAETVESIVKLIATVEGIIGLVP